MSEESLSRLETVPVRSVWPSEPRDFTPWLAEHIGELGEALGIELETVERESRVGGGYLDILATDVRSGSPVAIENQLGNSDDNHLGRLLIYAARTDADVVVWIARDFEEAHWLVLNWLNDRTGIQTRFFGVVIEAWKIGGSRPAPYFRVVSAPRDWRKVSITRSKPRYRDFRTGLEEELRSTSLPLQPGKDHSNPWLAINHVRGLNYSIDFRHDIFFSFQLDTRGGQRLEWCYEAFDRLQRNKEAIESELGELIWRRKWQNTRGSTIMSYYSGTFSSPRSSWPEIYEWVVERYRRFREVFEPYREELLGSPLSHTAREGQGDEV